MSIVYNNKTLWDDIIWQLIAYGFYLQYFFNIGPKLLHVSVNRKTTDLCYCRFYSNNTPFYSTDVLKEKPNHKLCVQTVIWIQTLK